VFWVWKGGKCGIALDTEKDPGRNDAKRRKNKLYPPLGQKEGRPVAAKGNKKRGGGNRAGTTARVVTFRIGREGKKEMIQEKGRKGRNPQRGATIKGRMDCSPSDLPAAGWNANRLGSRCAELQWDV